MERGTCHQKAEKDAKEKKGGPLHGKAPLVENGFLM
jgi:hypothetical protein